MRTCLNCGRRYFPETTNVDGCCSDACEVAFWADPDAATERHVRRITIETFGSNTGKGHDPDIE